MDNFDPRAALVAAFVIALFARVIAAHWRNWGLAEWARFVAHLAVSAGLVFLSFLMAGATALDSAVAGPPHGLWRSMYAVADVILVLYGVVSGIQVLVSSTGDAYNPALFRGYLHAMAIFVLAIGFALWVAFLTNTSSGRVASVLIGGLLLWLGSAMPPWLEAAARGSPITGALSRSGVRVLYGALGVGAIVGGVTGWPLWLH